MVVGPLIDHKKKEEFRRKLFSPQAKKDREADRKLPGQELGRSKPDPEKPFTKNASVSKCNTRLPTSVEHYKDLCAAVRNGDEKEVARLLHLGANSIFLQRDLNSLLPDAARKQRWDIVKLLAEHGAVDQCEFINCAFSGRTDILQLFINNGARIDDMGSHGTALMWSANGGVSESVQILIDAGASRNLCDSKGENALVLASKQRSNPHGFNIEVVRILLENGADPNLLINIRCCLEPQRLNPLTIAIESTNLQLAKLLLEHGADPNLRLHWKDTTPFKIARERFKDGQDSADMFKLLKSYGAKRGFLWW